MAGAPDPPPTSVLLADDDDRFRSLVRGLLEDDGYVVVAEASNAVDAVRLAADHRPDVVVLDLIMPELDPGVTDDAAGVVIDRVTSNDAGLRAAADLVQRLPGVRIVIVSSLFDPDVEQEADRLGVRYVEKVGGIDALEAAIEATAGTAGADGTA